MLDKVTDVLAHPPHTAADLEDCLCACSVADTGMASMILVRVAEGICCKSALTRAAGRQSGRLVCQSMELYVSEEIHTRSRKPQNRRPS